MSLDDIIKSSKQFRNPRGRRGRGSRGGGGFRRGGNRVNESGGVSKVRNTGSGRRGFGGRSPFSRVSPTIHNFVIDIVL